VDDKLISKLSKAEDMECLTLRYQAIILAHGPVDNYITGSYRFSLFIYLSFFLFILT
jgi:hypothetical protein